MVMGIVCLLQRVHLRVLRGHLLEIEYGTLRHRLREAVIDTWLRLLRLFFERSYLI